MSRSTTEKVRSTRRTFVRAAGLGAAAAAGSTFLPATGAAQEDEDDGEGEEEPAGYLVFVYDDSPAEDYSETFQVHEEYGVPGCVAACPGLMGTTRDWLYPGHLEQMYESGWEVMSHTLEHRALGEVPVAEDVEEGDTEIYVESNVHGRFEGDPLVVFDDEGTEAEATVAGQGEDDDGQYLELEEPIDEGFTAGYETRVRYTDEFTEEVLSESQSQLEEMVGEGQVTGYVHTFERDDGLVSELVPEYYDAVPQADGDGLNPEYEPDPHDLSRRYFEEDEMDEAEIERFLDQVANEPDFGILAGHSHYETLPPERVETAIEMALERDIEIVTLQEALDTFGVVEAPERTERDADETSGTDDDEDDEDADTDPDADEDEDEEESEGLFDRILSLFRSLFD
jgi:hypothetical protein